MSNRNLIVALGLVIAVISFCAGYALFSSSVVINGTGSIASTWDIEVTGIGEKTKQGKATSITEPTFTKTSASFNTKLSRSGDLIEYEVALTNRGNLKGVVESVTVTNPNNMVKVEVYGISQNDVIVPGEVKKYTIKIYIPESTKVTEDVTSQVGIDTKIVQDNS